MELRLPYDVTSVSSARRLVGDYAEARLSDRRLDELVLMTSEVVTNAVTHGSAEPDGGIGLRLEEDQGAVRIVVTDDGEGFALDLDNAQHRAILRRYGKITRPDVPIRVVVRPGQRAKYADVVEAFEVWEHEPTVAELDGFVAGVEATDR